MNLAHCERRKKKNKTQNIEKKKGGGGGGEGGKSVVRKRAIKTDRATNERGKKKKGAEGLGRASFAQLGAGCFKGRHCPKDPEHYAGSAGGAQAPLLALVLLTTSTLRFVLNVHFY